MYKQFESAKKTDHEHSFLSGNDVLFNRTKGNTLSTQKIYSRLVKRRILCLCLMGLILFICIVSDLLTGPSIYSVKNILSAFFDPNAPIALHVILYDIRLPAALTAVIVGASLSVAGVQMQTVLDNPLASPFTLGVSAAASFGAALGFVLGVPLLPSKFITYAIPLNAFIMSMVAVLSIERIARWRNMNNVLIVLLGTTLVFAFTALLQALQYAVPEQALAAVVFWTMGSLARTDSSQLLFITAIFLVVTFFFMRNSWALTAMSLGEVRATAMGIPVARLRLKTIVLSSLLASVCVAFVGSIGFIGLIGPHIARMLVGGEQRFLIPASAFCGAALLSAASVTSKIIFTGQLLPIGIVTSLVGVPLFFILIIRGKPLS